MNNRMAKEDLMKRGSRKFCLYLAALAFMLWGCGPITETGQESQALSERSGKEVADLDRVDNVRPRRVFYQGFYLSAFEVSAGAQRAEVDDSCQFNMVDPKVWVVFNDPNLDWSAFGAAMVALPGGGYGRALWMSALGELSPPGQYGHLGQYRRQLTITRVLGYSGQPVRRVLGACLCPPVTCDLYCPYGYQKDEKGCEICRCVNRCEPVLCDLHCEYGFARDVNGCEICQCNKPPECAPAPCFLHCRHGYKKDEKGCDTCECNPPPQCDTDRPADCQMACENGYEHDPMTGCAICKCAEPCICTDVWIPVCGCDGRTYSNSCYARCAGVEVCHDQACAGPVEDCRSSSDRAVCPDRTERRPADGSSADLGNSGSALVERPPLVPVLKQRLLPFVPIATEVTVHDFGPFLELRVMFLNKTRIAWKGDFYVERTAPQGAVKTLIRMYGQRLGPREGLGMFILMVRPEEMGTHVFKAKAVQLSGQDSKLYGRLQQADRLVRKNYFSSQVMRFDVSNPIPVAESASLERGGLVSVLPIYTRLDLRIAQGVIHIRSQWQNRSRMPWKGQLYVEVQETDGSLVVLRLNESTFFMPGFGMSALDTYPVPRALSAWLIFRTRALTVSGLARVAWVNPGTTEITAVCANGLCELIKPEQRYAQSKLTGKSILHLRSDFFGESVRVEMKYGSNRFDITSKCRIRQYQEQGRNHVEVSFDTMNLPIGPRTWANYTVTLYPMPVIPTGAKTADSLWALTNGPE